MPSEIFPTDFAPDVRVAAFGAGDEVAWLRVHAAAAVEWFATNDYAFLGTELWVLKDGAVQSLPTRLSGIREVQARP
jgi:hypothetical protein